MFTIIDFLLIVLLSTYTLIKLKVHALAVYFILTWRHLLATHLHSTFAGHPLWQSGAA